MASPPSTRAIVLSLLTTVLPLTEALRVTPNSPCTSVCADSSDPATDPNYLDNEWMSIVCEDDEFDNTSKGQQVKGCLGCLQNSNFTQGSENDQDWFLYNLRYSLDYCEFGYPNSTGFNSGPCMTSEACGPLASPLEEGVPDPSNSSQYAYCNVSGVSILGASYQKCMECVQADENHYYLSNFLVALAGACQTTPPPGSIVPLNATVFSNVTIHLIDPATSTVGGSRLSAAAIAGIVVGVLALAGLAAGCVFMLMRKRRSLENRRSRASVLSFRCQASVPPVELQAEEHDCGDRFFAGEKASAPVAGIAAVATDASPPGGEHQSSASWNPQCAPAALAENAAAKPSVITALPPASPAHASSPQRFSPDDYTTPTSTISTRSSAPLLARHPGASFSSLSANSPPPPASSAEFRDVSPRIDQSGWQGETVQPDTLWEEGGEARQQQQASSRGLAKKKSKGGMGMGMGMGRPVQSERLQTTFPPPPKR